MIYVVRCVGNLHVFVAVQCGQPETMTNGTIAMVGNGYLDTINYTCLEGHYYSDGESMRTSVCQANESWTIETAQSCEREY